MLLEFVVVGHTCMYNVGMRGWGHMCVMYKIVHYWCNKLNAVQCSFKTEQLPFLLWSQGQKATDTWVAA